MDWTIPYSLCLSCQLPFNFAAKMKIDRDEGTDHLLPKNLEFLQRPGSKVLNELIFSCSVLEMNHFFLYSLQGSALIPGFDTIIDLSQNL